MDIIQRYPAVTPLTLTFVLSLAGLGLGPGGGPSFISSTALITTILIYTRSHELQKYLAQWAILTLSITLSHSKASLSALSSPSMSIFMLSLLSSVSALFALTPICLTHIVSSKLPNYRILVFPTFWTLMWLLVSRASPIGRLLTWTPLTGTSSYAWILPILGLPGLDFISALWASAAAEYLYNSPDDGPSKDQVLLPDLAPRTENGIAANMTSQKRLFSSLTLLLALTIPSFTTTSLPPPSHSDAPAHVPLSVSCILPPPVPSASPKSQLDQFIDETKAYISRSKVMLWPEGAVTFESEAARNQALDRIKEEVFNNGKQGNLWVGVSFLQRIAGGDKTGTRDGMYQNGMTLVGPKGIVEFTYYKRNLVPIAESFGQLPSKAAPPLHTIQLHKLKENVTLTAGICLDFSSPLFPERNELQTSASRPSLILAPARTWDTQVGQAMYSLARVRAKEIGAELLWCDGGAGGLSGVGDDIQVGWGSWSKDIGIPNENNEDSNSSATLYAKLGDFGVIVLMLGLWGAAHVVSISDVFIERIGRLSLTTDAFHQATDWIRRNAIALWTRIRERITGNRSTAPLLIQIDDEEERLI